MGSDQSFYEFMKANFEGNWNQTLHDGFAKSDIEEEATYLKAP